MKKPHRVRAGETARKDRVLSRMRKGKNAFFPRREAASSPGLLLQLYWPWRGWEKWSSAKVRQRLLLEVMTGAGKSKFWETQAHEEACNACREYLEAFVKFRRTPEVGLHEL